MKDTPPEKKEFTRAIYYPLLLLCIIWSVKLLEWFSGNSFASLGIHPLKINGLAGIFFSPFIHADIWHLLNNSVPLVVLSSALFYFYRPVAAKVFGLIWVTTGICVWIAGRHAYHIGASGIIYGLASFLFFSGIFRRNIKLMAISLLIIFLYGSMIWGVFPFVAEISWESHLFGGLSGLAFARVYSRKIILSEIRQPVEEAEDDTEFPYWEIENDELKDNTKTNPNDTTNYVN